MRRVLIAALSVALMTFAMGAPLVAAKNGGNSTLAKQCQKGGYVNYVDASGTVFSTEQACTSFGAQNGYLTPKPVTFQAVCESYGGTYAGSYNATAPACLWTGVDYATWYSAYFPLRDSCYALGHLVQSNWDSVRDPDFIGCFGVA